MLPHEPNIHEKEGRFYLVFYDANRRPQKKWVPLRTDTERTAERRAKPITAKYMQGEFDPWTDDPDSTTPTITEAVTSYLDAREDDLSKRTWKTYKYDLTPLKEQFGDRKLDSLTPSEIEMWCRRDDTSNRTVQKRLTELKTFYNYFVDRQIIDENPVENLSAPRVESDPPRYPSRDEYNTLIREIQSHVDGYEDDPQRQASRQWLLHGVRLAVHTGLRRGSLIALRWGDIDFEDGYIYVRAEDAKRDGHTIPLLEKTREILEKIGPSDGEELVLIRDDGSAIPPRMFTRQFNRFVEAANLPEEITLHTCRDTFASWLVQEGVPIYKVSSWLGHSTVKVTERYAHLAPTSVDERANDAFS